MDGDGSKVLEQARLDMQKPYVESSLEQVADIEGENSLTTVKILSLCLEPFLRVAHTAAGGRSEQNHG